MSHKDRGTKSHKTFNLVDVIVPVYGQPQRVAECVKPFEGDDRFRVTLVDDASPKEDYSALLETYKAYHYIRNAKNLGFPSTVNKGVKNTMAPLLLILNSDVVLETAGLDILVREMDNPKTGIVVPMLLFPASTPHGPEGTIQHVGMAFNIKGEPNHLFVGWSPDNPRAVVRRSVRCVTGACMMVRRAVWDRVKGFDPVYGRGTYEDVEFCLNVKHLGYNIIVNPEARGAHFVGGSSHSVGQNFPLQHNSMIFRSRNVGAGKVLWDEYLHC